MSSFLSSFAHTSQINNNNLIKSFDEFIYSRNIFYSSNLHNKFDEYSMNRQLTNIKRTRNKFSMEVFNKLALKNPTQKFEIIKDNLSIDVVLENSIIYNSFYSYQIKNGDRTHKLRYFNYVKELKLRLQTSPHNRGLNRNYAETNLQLYRNVVIGAIYSYNELILEKVLNNGKIEFILHNNTASGGNFLSQTTSRIVNRCKSILDNNNLTYTIKHNNYHFTHCERGIECSICLDTNRAIYVEVPCEHKFHKSCIKRWIDAGHNNCPLCRADLRLHRYIQSVIF